MNRPTILALAFLACTWALPAATTANPKTAKRRHPSAAGATARTKTPAKSSASKKTATRKNASANSRRGKKTRRTRSYQQAPTPERYKEIQQALAAKGYYRGEINGQWGLESVDALKRFQADQNLMPDGKINSLSLIALGLGPKRLTAKSDSSALPSPAAPKAEPPR